MTKLESVIVYFGKLLYFIARRAGPPPEKTLAWVWSVHGHGFETVWFCAGVSVGVW